MWLDGLLADETRRLALEKLDAPMRAKLLAALAAFVILWFALIALVWLGARAARRYMKSPIDDARRPPFAGGRDDDWAAEPLFPTEDDEKREEDQPR